jgi:hypothetical protein
MSEGAGIGKNVSVCLLSQSSSTDLLEKCRGVYNQMLEGLNLQEKPNKLELQSTLPKLREKYPELKEVHSKVLQHEVCRLFSNLLRKLLLIAYVI